ncbi:hypothetical protein BVH65_17585 [Vibrio cholerae]|nr:hypothetical protein [Vibrio cholerae]MBO1371634.1 hypothetical protein [Vibrio cholerae]MBO1375180.1 hypothetical protein [Vibrio cholerae]MBO1379076.1 hypothetical protein [Vibrio cholerae]MBO1408917.1 hypothetical protein [Vibrio cholerae]
MTLKSTILIGRLIKALFLVLSIYSYYDTEFIPLILVFATYLGIDEIIASKRLDDIEKKLKL